ncbi:MAG: C39 family peptidase, partial [Acidobacteriota bacterium]
MTTHPILSRALALSLSACVGQAPDAPVPGPPAAGSAVTSPEAAAPHVVGVRYEIQSTGYWCGPTATDIALSARIAPPGQAALAQQLHTTTDGTDRVGQVTDVLNANLGATWFATREMPDDPPTQAQRDLLWHDLTRAVDDGFAFVANIVAPASNHPPGYPSTTIYHYFTVIGYDPVSRDAYIADPAD